MISAAALRRRPGAPGLWAAATLAWLAAVLLARSMAPMGGMSPGLWAFLAMWVPMMAAMMLPSVEPFAGLWVKTVQSERATRLVLFASGYLLAWALIGLPAFALVALGGWLADHHPGGATALAVTFFASCGVYQLTPLKERCLRHCRSPLASVVHYASIRGRLRDLRVGLRHAGWCVGCCWALMVVLVAFGTMNLLAMVALAAVVFAEKRWRVGPAVAKAVGVACLVLAVVAVWWPGLAPALHHASVTRMPAMGSGS